MMNKKTISLGMAFCLCLTGATAVLSGCAGNQYDRSTGQYIDDKGLAYRVKDALKDNAEYKLSNVDVKVFRANVQLSGFVATLDQKKKAGDIAAHVPGVQGVENNITVKNELNQRG